MRNREENRFVDGVQLFILVFYLVATIPFVGGSTGWLAYFATEYFFASNLVSWVAGVVIGVPAGLGFGWVAYKDMTKKRSR